MPGKPPSCILASLLWHPLGLAKALPFPLETFPPPASSLRTCLTTPEMLKGGWALSPEGFHGGALSHMASVLLLKSLGIFYN